MPDNRPHSRKRGTPASSGTVNRHGSGLHSGSSGTRVSYGGGPIYSGGYGRGPRRHSGLFLLLVIFLAVFLIMPSCEDSSYSPSTHYTADSSGSSYGYQPPQAQHSDTDMSAPDLSVSAQARAKYTALRNDGSDEATILVYMIGTDLESRYGMATSDLNEMLKAEKSDQVHILIGTGGTKQWKNNVVSDRNNELYEVTSDHQLQRLNSTASRDMTDPDTLTDFIRDGVSRYPSSDRLFLILWDHGGGSVSGYGHDELYPNGTMNVSEFSDALKNADVKFDAVGFDACLMANAETALAASPYADYLIASEETEPGTGWYYTGWITALSENPSISTVELGKQIIDDFIGADTSSGEKTTLSITDLAEFETLVPPALKAFSESLNDEIQAGEYQKVADARSVTREFASSSRIDQIDLVHFCENLGTEEAEALAAAVRTSLKYNRTSGISDASGLSIYFPYSRTKYVTEAAGIYDDIGMDSSYTEAIRSFATLEASGQIVTGSSTPTIFGLLSGNSSYNGSDSWNYSSGDILSLLTGSSSAPASSSSYGSTLESLLGGNSYDSDLLSQYASLLSDRGTFDTSELTVTEVNGSPVLHLSESQWSLIRQITQNVWVDDGCGYIDLGSDNVFSFDDEGNLLVDYDGTWLSVEGQPVSYRMLSDEYDDSTGSYVTTGSIPILLNDEPASLLVEFTNENPDGTVTGVLKNYDDGVSSRTLPLEEGDTIEFTADYYSYGGTYQDAYRIGTPVTYDGSLALGTYRIRGQKCMYTYVLTDVYNNELRLPMQNWEGR
ncbi:MAG: clostripain-related cysteine peptidase [Bulleidia sp.]